MVYSRATTSAIAERLPAALFFPLVAVDISAGAISFEFVQVMDLVFFSQGARVSREREEKTMRLFLYATGCPWSGVVPAARLVMVDWR